MDLVTRDKVADVFRELYIISGYRQTDITISQCIKYVFVMHNDCGNFWTHFIPFLLWIVWLPYISCRLDLSDPFWYPLLTLWLGHATVFLTSSIAHLFGCKSKLYRNICFMIDYHGISSYMMGGSIAYYFYEQPLDESLFNYKWTFILTNVIINLSATLMCCLSRFYLRRYRFVIQIGSYIIPFIINFFPFHCKLLLYIINGNQTVPVNLPNHLLIYFLILIAVFFFVSKIPERFSPGRFDYLFHSHQLFYVTNAVLCSIQLHTIQLDAQLYYSTLTNSDYYVGSFNSTFFPFSIFFSIGFVVITILVHLCLSDEFKFNKIN